MAFFLIWEHLGKNLFKCLNLIVIFIIVVQMHPKTK